MVGEPDYLIAPRTKYGDMGVPPLYIVEAKKDIEEGWTQTLAEMVAASLQGGKTLSQCCHHGQFLGVWTAGEPGVHQGGKKNFATIDLQEVFDMLNWALSVAAAELKK